MVDIEEAKKELAKLRKVSKEINSQALEIIEAEMEATKERDQIILFIKNSQRGIMKGYTGN